MFKTLMLSLVEGNKIISSIKITITENDQKRLLTHFWLSVVVSLYIIYVWAVHRVISWYGLYMTYTE